MRTMKDDAVSMKPQAIYLDTTVFFEARFCFSRGPLADLALLALEKDIWLWSSDIALTELQVAMRDRVRDIQASYEKAHGVLQHCQNLSAPSPDSIESAVRDALDAVKNFFHDEDVSVLSVESLDESDTARIFEDYFNSRGCFSNKGKRTEFPDAFQIAMILRAVRTGEKVIVVSNDKDFAEGFADVPEVQVIRSVEKVLPILRQL